MSQLKFFEPPIWTVSYLTRYLRDLLASDEQLQEIWVEGEVSNFTRATSGHLYFTMKDDTSALRCVMWRNAAQRMLSLPRDGDAVEVHGSLGIYELGGQYQLYVDLIRPLGEGALYQEFLRLKARLEAEGLFDPARKRPIPRLPRRIAIITSPTGAALRDILNTLQRRYPLVEIFLSPAPVQGVEAPPGIIAALDAANRIVHPDVIILARGGGSIEDLWAFNDEAVARAIAASAAPVISGVGHETDFTIADFVSDMRAPTPTAAAELATPNKIDLAAGLQESISRMLRATQITVNSHRWQLNRLENLLRQNSPRTRLFSNRQRLDDWTRRASRAVDQYIALQYAHLAGLEQRLYSLNPIQVLQRGFAILSNTDGSPVHSVHQVQPGDTLTASLKDGELTLTTREIHPSSKKQ